MINDSLNKYKIDDRIFSVRFSCDLQKCKGACCTLKGAGGAPLLDSELQQIKSAFAIVKKYLPQKSIDVMEAEGIYYGEKGDYSLNSVEDADCVFAFEEYGIAKCAFQKAFNEGEIDFPKPVSCHLFPIRISGKKRNIIRYEKINECEDALEKGSEIDVSIFEFAEEALVREFGRNFYDELKKRFMKKTEHA